MFTRKYICMQTCSHLYLIYQLLVLMIYNRRRFYALYVMFSDNKIPYPGRTWKNLEEPGRTWKTPGTHKAVHISLLAVSTTYDVTRETERRI